MVERGLGVVCALALVAGCSDGPRSVPIPIGKIEDPIVGGTLDHTHQAVVAVFGSSSACTGTIISKAEPYAFVLTAAHCVDDAPQQVIQGDDYNDSGSIVYNVDDYLADPLYNMSVHDFAMVRIIGAGPATPVIPAMTPAQDNLTDGTPVTQLGYGNIGTTPTVSTSERHTAPGTVVDTTTLTITFDFDSHDSGVCFGDSGGPNLSTGTERVAGVNSSVSTSECDGLSFSGRVSAVYNSFIQPYINMVPPPPADCNGCFEVATTGNGGCTDDVDACFDDSECNALVGCYNGCSTASCYQGCTDDHPGGIPLYNAIFTCVCTSACATECADASMCDPGEGGAPPTTDAVAQSSVQSSAEAGPGSGGGVGAGGAGGAAPSSATGWFAGDADNENPKGTILTSGCSQRGGAEAGGWLIAMAAVALAAARKRRA
jgi:hypothetical protein